MSSLAGGYRTPWRQVALGFAPFEVFSRGTCSVRAAVVLTLRVARDSGLDDAYLLETTADSVVTVRLWGR